MNWNTSVNDCSCAACISAVEDGIDQLPCRPRTLKLLLSAWCRRRPLLPCMWPVAAMATENMKIASCSQLVPSGGLHRVRGRLPAGNLINKNWLEQQWTWRCGRGSNWSIMHVFTDSACACTYMYILNSCAAAGIDSNQSLCNVTWINCIVRSMQRSWSMITHGVAVQDWHESWGCWRIRLLTSTK